MTSNLVGLGILREDKSVFSSLPSSASLYVIRSEMISFKVNKIARAKISAYKDIKTVDAS